jgi:uncharacterized protein
MAMVRDEDSVLRILRDSRRVAVLGIKTEAQRSAPAYYVPAYLQRAGYEVIPVPVYYPDATTILGEPVYRRLADIPGSARVDLAAWWFRRPQDIPQHVDRHGAGPWRTTGGGRGPSGSSWASATMMTSRGAARLAEAGHGIEVVQDRCTMIDHRRSSSDGRHREAEADRAPFVCCPGT